jgi:hypothetical protein
MGPEKLGCSSTWIWDKKSRELTHIRNPAPPVNRLAAEDVFFFCAL